MKPSFGHKLMAGLALFTTAAAVMAGEAFAPRDLPGLVLHLDAADTNNVTIIDGRVSVWRDGSSNRYDAVQAVHDLRPVPLPGTADRPPVLRFYALGVMLQTACIPATHDAPRTIVMALTSVDEAPGPINHLLHYGSPHLREAYGITSRGFGTNAWGNHYWADGFITGIRSDAGGGYIVVASYRAGEDHITVNGGETATQAMALNTAAGTYGTHGIVVGARIEPYFGQPAEPGGFECGEVLAFSRALEPAEQQQLEGYLAHKWGLADRLPATHPYQSTAP